MKLRLSEHDVRRVAVAVGANTRLVRAFLADPRAVSEELRERIPQALTRLGIEVGEMT